MGVNEKLKIDLYAILVLQLMWSSFGFVFEEYQLDKQMVFLILVSYFVVITMHFVLSDVLINNTKIISYIKWYICALVVVNTALIASSTVSYMFILIGLVAIFLLSKYIKVNITKAMSIKRKDGYSLSRMLIILTGALLGTYIPQAGIVIAYIVVNIINIYLYQKHVYLLKIENTEESNR